MYAFTWCLRIFFRRNSKQTANCLANNKDVRKAFDTESHNIQLQKLYHYGIRGTAYKLLESYLSFRNQSVSVQNYHSSSKAINIGALQGSILGPFYFLCASFISYVNDIPNSVFCNALLFADDTCLLVSSPLLTVLEIAKK